MKIKLKKQHKKRHESEENLTHAHLGVSNSLNVKLFN